MLKRFLIFLIINFGALALGSLFTNEGINSDWYQGLNQAPWIPPGWVFGAAWTCIMICFSFFMAILWPKVINHKGLLTLFIVQWILNVGWNPVFFKFQQVEMGAVVISALTIIVGVFQFKFLSKLGANSILITPYFLWLMIATSLNVYILLYN